MTSVLMLQLPVVCDVRRATGGRSNAHLARYTPFRAISAPGAPITPSVHTGGVTNISRAGMNAVSNDLWTAGKIDLQELGMLQLAGPLGKVGPNGEFIPFTAAERAELDRQPVDYVSVAERAIAEIDYRHAAGDARSGYEKWKHILETLQRP